MPSVSPLMFHADSYTFVHVDVFTSVLLNIWLYEAGPVRNKLSAVISYAPNGLPTVVLIYTVPVGVEVVMALPPLYTASYTSRSSIVM